MCEPRHSISQWPEELGDDDDGQVANDLSGSRAQKRLPGWFRQKLEQIRGRWFGRFAHISRFGSGHTDSLFQLESGVTVDLGSSVLPLATKWQSRWWDRVVRIDGLFKGVSVDRDAAQKAAEAYATATCLGSLSLF